MLAHLLSSSIYASARLNTPMGRQKAPRAPCVSCGLQFAMQLGVEHWAEYARVVTALLVITSPVSAIPYFLTVTHNRSVEAKREIARVSALTVALVLMATAVFGEYLLLAFGVSVASFRVGGGILLLLMAIDMLQADESRTRQTPEEVGEAEHKQEVAIIPLAIPLLAGPGAISTVVMFMQRATSWRDTVFMLCACVFVAGSVWVSFRLADRIGHVLGQTGINIITRIMGLMLAAVAVDFIAEGVVQLLPGLNAPGVMTPGQGLPS